jgi:FAD/FMN-containing dehydrogenase
MDISSNGLAEIVGAANVLIGDDIGDRYRSDFLKKHVAAPAVVLRPASTQEVSEILKLAHREGTPVTAIGGQTGMCGAAMASPGGIALSLERMNRIEEIDPASMTMTVQAGCVLQVAHEAAEAEGVFLPLDLGARGSAMIGGVIGTNAGGNRVLRWGMMRDMVLGLEVVLADGRIVSSLGKMIKDNAGYNWKHLLIGSEGTLGVVTRAVLRLRPLPTTHQTAIVATESFEDTIRLLRKLDASLSGRLSSFELLWGDCYERVVDAQLDQLKRPVPLAKGHGFYTVVEAMGSDKEGDDAQFERALAAELEGGLIVDAAVANSESQRATLWGVRDEMHVGFMNLMPFCNYDVSMAQSVMPTFVARVREDLAQRFPNAVSYFYGHAGDGNLHAIVNPLEPGKPLDSIAVDRIVFGVVRELGGSIAAEHGIGTLRREFLDWTRSEDELWMMRAIKQALDPRGILNPGKVL